MTNKLNPNSVKNDLKEVIEHLKSLELSEKGKEVSEQVKDKSYSAFNSLDEYTKSRGSTGGDFDKSSMFQGGFNGTIEGFYFMGPKGVAIATPAALIGIAVTNKTGSVAAGVAAGATAGFILGFAIGNAVGGPAAGTALGMKGSVLGTMQTLRGDAEADTRDGGGGARMLAAPVLPGILKNAPGIGAAIGSKMDSKAGKLLAGGATAAIAAGLISAAGLSPVSLPVAVGVSALAGAFGQEFGERFSQFFRNLSNDFGEKIEEGAQKTGLFEDGMGERMKNVAGTIPSTYIKEGLTAFLVADGDLASIALGGTLDSIKQSHIFLTSQIDDDSPKKPDNAETVDDILKKINSKTIDEAISKIDEEEFSEIMNEVVEVMDEEVIGEIIKETSDIIEDGDENVKEQAKADKPDKKDN
jgi:hypothetical protein